MRLAAVVLAISHIPPLFLTDDLVHTALCLVAGLATIAVGYKHGLRSLIGFGLLMAAFAVGRPVMDFVQWLDFSNWITLSLVGGTAIVTASVIERHGAFLKMKWDRVAEPAE